MCKIHVDIDNKDEECTWKVIFSFVACYLLNCFKACLEAQQAALYEE